MKTIIHLERSEKNLKIISTFGNLITEVTTNLQDWIKNDSFVIAEVYFASSYIGIETEGSALSFIQSLNKLGFE